LAGVIMDKVALSRDVDHTLRLLGSSAKQHPLDTSKTRNWKTTAQLHDCATCTG
jgi:hypothetical protein